MKNIIKATLLCIAFANSLAANSQTLRDQNARVLKPYMTARVISSLEWDLLQFNLLWQGSFVGSVDYLTSYPVIFEPKTMRFRATFTIQDKREVNDPDPFYKIPRAQRLSITQGAIDQLIQQLGQAFPEVNTNRNLVYAEFWFRSTGGGRSVVGKYENGIVALAE